MPGQTYYIAVGAYDGEAADLDADGIPGVVIWSPETTGVPLGASFELAATDPAVTVVGGGDSADHLLQCDQHRRPRTERGPVR